MADVSMVGSQSYTPINYTPFGGSSSVSSSDGAGFPYAAEAWPGLGETRPADSFMQCNAPEPDLEEKSGPMGVLSEVADWVKTGFDGFAASMSFGRPGGGFDIERLGFLGRLHLGSKWLGWTSAVFKTADTLTSNAPVTEGVKWGLADWIGCMAGKAMQTTLTAGSSILDAGSQLFRFGNYAKSTGVGLITGKAVENIVDGYAKTPADIWEGKESYNEMSRASTRYNWSQTRKAWNESGWFGRLTLPFTATYKAIGSELKAAATWSWDRISSWF